MLPETAIAYHSQEGKADWGEGPWIEEPDKIQWIDPATDLDCLIVRNRMGSLCGYVGLPPGHPDYGKHYDDGDGYDVHGGLTFAGSCQEGPEDSAICHVPAEGRPDNVWWLGFDCGHFMDVSPALEARTRKMMDDHPEWSGGLRSASYLTDGTYKTVAYVVNEVEGLARQVKERAT